MQAKGWRLLGFVFGGNEPVGFVLVAVLVAARLLKPLGNPPPNSVKFFAAAEVLEQAKDRSWLAKVTNTLNLHWQRKNACKKSLLLNGHGRAVRAMAAAGGELSLPPSSVQGREQAGF